jgi:DNA-binding ferritin-like protein
MSEELNNNNKNVKDEKELDRKKKVMRYELESLREDFLEAIEDLQEDFKDHVDDLRERKEEITDELKDELQELVDEKEYLLRDIDDASEELKNLGEGAVEKIEEAKEQLLKLKGKKEKSLEKHLEKLKKNLDKAKKKAVKRINISVDEDTSDEWRDWSEELGSSVSELIRKSMRFVKNNIGDLSKLDELGESIERAVKESGIEDLGDKLEHELKGKNGKPKIKIDLSTSNTKTASADKDQIKKRVRGLIKLQKSLPIVKLAQALNRANKDAENLIYELVDEGIEGSLEEGVFKFTSSPEDVISKINELIDKM